VQLRAANDLQSSAPSTAALVNLRSTYSRSPPDCRKAESATPDLQTKVLSGQIYTAAGAVITLVTAGIHRPMDLASIMLF